MKDFKIPEFIDKIPKKQYNIIDYGAVDDGVSLNTEYFGKTIEECSRYGGGTIIVPEGKWLTGPIHLKSNINIRLEKGAVIEFTDVYSEYLPVVFTRWEGVECYNYSPLIYAEDCENIAITGDGTLAGNGESWWHWKSQKLQQDAAERLYNAEYNKVPVEKRVFGTEKDALRPSFIQPINSKNILIEGIRIENGPMWTIHPVYCEDVIIRKVTVMTGGGYNTDGLNPDSSKNILIEDCYFETGDDCIAINSGMNEDGWRVGRPCENIIIRNCHMNEGHGCVAIGSGMSGGVRNVYVENCKFTGGDMGIRLKSMRGRGGYIRNIHMKNIKISDMRCEGITINMYYASSSVNPQSDTPPVCEDVILENISISNVRNTISLRGLPEKPVERIKLLNINAEGQNDIVCKDIKGITFDNVRL